MKRRLIYGLAAIALLAGANVAYALTALGSSAVNLSGLRLGTGSYTHVTLIPKPGAKAIPVRLKLHGNLWLSGFGRRNWFDAVIETEELDILAWERPVNRSETRLVLRAQSEELDPAASIRFAFREGKAERLPDFDGLSTYRLDGTRTQPRFVFLESPEWTASRRSSVSSTAATRISASGPT